MKIKNGFVVERVGSKYLAVAVGVRADEFNALIRMNETGAFIWQKLAESDRSAGELTKLLCAEYSVPEDVAASDVGAFIEKLRSAGLLDE